MQKVKHDFQLANKEMLSGNIYMIQNCFALFDCNYVLTFKLSPACGTLNESVVNNQTRSQSRNEINTHTIKKHNNLL